MPDMSGLYFKNQENDIPFGRLFMHIMFLPKPGTHTTGSDSFHELLILLN